MKKLINITFICIILAINMNAQITLEGCIPDTNNKLVIPVLPYEDQVLPPLGPPVSPPPGPVSDSSEYRMVYWIHGMNGSASSWSQAATASSSADLVNVIPGFSPRKIYPVTPDYSPIQYSLNTAQTYLAPQLTLDIRLPHNYDLKNSFVIAHSQGGIVTRAMIQADIAGSRPHLFHGFVTFGSVHRGAVALTAPNKKLGYKFFENAAVDLSSGYLQEFQNDIVDVINKFQNGFFGKLIGVNIQIPGQDEIKTFLREKLFYNPVTDKNGFVLEMIRGFVESPMAPELAVGSPSLNALNNSNPGMPSAAFYGNKRAFTHIEYGKAPLLVEPFWALMHYSLNDVNEENYFDAKYDWKLAKQAREVQLDYRERALDYRNLIDLLENFKTFPPCIIGCNCDPILQYIFSTMPISEDWSDKKKKKVCKSKKKKEQLAKMTSAFYAFRVGDHWFNNANAMWEVVVGALSEETTGYCVATILNLESSAMEELRYQSAPGESCGDNPPPIPQGYKKIGPWRNETIIVRKPYDGAVLAESARDLPFMTANMIVEGINVAEMLGSGHMQMRNDKNTKAALNYIFNGDLDAHFKTEPQD